MVKVENYNGQDVNWWQEKMNGHRVKITRQNDGTFLCETKTKGVDIADAIMKHPCSGVLYEMPTSSIIDCELHAPGINATNVKPMLANMDKRLVLSAFAVYAWDGEMTVDWTFDKAMTHLEDRGLNPPEWGEVDECFPDELRAMALLSQIEGYVVKTEHCGGWYKIKPHLEVDAFVTGFTLSTSKRYKGQLKSIEMSMFVDGEVKVVANLGSMPAAFKRDFRLEDWEGQVAEVFFDNWTDNGMCNMPRFERWRDDKIKSECVMMTVGEVGVVTITR